MECQICYEQKAYFPLICHAICQECLKRYWIEQINAIDPPQKLSCIYKCYPHPSENLVSEIISERIFFQYKYFLAQKTIENKKIFFCPNKECSNPIIEVNKRLFRKKVVCTSCNQEICNRCELPYHKRKCPAKTKGKTKNWIWRLTHTKSCPKCGLRMEKNGGCRHMDCPKCDVAFCWACKGLIDGGGIKHRQRNQQKCCSWDRECHCISGSSSLFKEITTIVAVGCVIIISVPIVIIGITIILPIYIIERICDCISK